MERLEDRPLWHIVHVFEHARSTPDFGPGNVTRVTTDMPDSPPTVRQEPRERLRHGDTVTDEFAWLLNKEDPGTVAYLEAENAWTERATAHLAGLRDQIFGEIKGRTQETDLTVPIHKSGYWYYSRTVEGKQYPIRCRIPVRPGETDPPKPEEQPQPGEEVLLDGNVIAEGKDFFQLGAFDVSPDGNLLSYSTDFSGDERFTLRVKDLRTARRYVRGLR